MPDPSPPGKPSAGPLHAGRGPDRFCPQCGGGLDDATPRRCRTCGRPHYLDPKLAAGVIFRHEAGIFLQRRAIDPGRGLWTFPGGYVDRGETLEAAARREVEEEAGVRVQLVDLLGVYSYPRQTAVIVVYTGRIQEGVPHARSECLEARAFPERELPWDDLAFRSTREALRHYLEAPHDPARGRLGLSRNLHALPEFE